MGRMRAVLAGLVCAAWLVGCATTSAPPPKTSGSAPTPEAAKPPKSSRWREMTWAEYYSEVKERAWRRNAEVIWIWPPRVERVPKSEEVTSYTPCAQ
jgi:hypothetical protein